jgi:ferrous-iron efflux pump FieF
MNQEQARPPETLSPERAGRLMKLATYASVSVALVLIAAKFAAWLATDAVSMLSTLIDSLLDAGASLVSLIAVRQALQPADYEHRFGHGKAEPLAGLAQAAFICGSAVFLLVQAAERFVHPKAIENTDIGHAVMVFAIVVTLALVIFQRSVVRRTGSTAIHADSLHYSMDVMVNVSVIVSLLLSANLGWLWADPLFAIVIAGYIVWGAMRIGRKSLDVLMDRELSDEDRQRIYDLAVSHPDVRDLHDMRTRSSGLYQFIQLHLEMDGDISLNEAHVISEVVMEKIESAFPNAEVIIHEDPEGVDEIRDRFRAKKPSLLDKMIK